MPVMGNFAPTGHQNQFSGYSNNYGGKDGGKYHRVGKSGPDQDSNWRSRPVEARVSDSIETATYLSRSDVSTSFKRCTTGRVRATGSNMLASQKVETEELKDVDVGPG